jgi:hypothetical protein
VEKERTTEMTNEDLPVPGKIIPSRTVALITEYLAHVVDRDHGTKSGKTALYWHLAAVIHSHIKETADERRNSREGAETLGEAAEDNNCTEDETRTEKVYHHE